MHNSNFESDLSKEATLGVYLDSYYQNIFEKSNYTIERVSDINLQHQGVDLILKSGISEYLVDEKAQLDYLNKSLPTFSFELSYLKNKEWRLGWLLDETKITNIYFLVKHIHTNQAGNLESGITKIKITGIYRDRLITLLESKGLAKTELIELEKNIRLGEQEGKISIKELNPKTEGALYFSKSNKAEQPINLVLKLDYLIKNSVGKVLFEIEK